MTTARPPASDVFGLTETNTAIDALFYAKRIAIIGASPNPGFANGIHRNLIEGGYEGEIIPINPRYEEVLDSRAYPTVDGVPGGVEHAVVVVPSRFVLPVLEQCAMAGVKAANIISSGFGEQGDEEAHERQYQLQEFVARTGVRLVGPNCLGIISTPNRQVTKTGQYEGVQPGPVGLVFQSGLLAFSIGIPAKYRKMGFTYIVTTGNEADLEAADYIRYMVEDDATRVIGCFIEQFRDPAKLIEAAQLAADRQIPIVVLKVGRSEHARRAAQAHTGSLVGSDDIVDAVMRQHGIIRVYSLEEMTETLIAFHTDRLPKGPGVAAMFASGGAAGLFSDLSDELGVEFPIPTPETAEKLEQLIPEYGTVGNPLDFTGQAWLIPGVVEGCLDALGTDPNIHCIIYGQAFPTLMDLGTEVGEAFKTFPQRYPDKLLFISSLVTGEVKPGMRFDLDPVDPELQIGGVPFLQGAENTLRAMKSIVDYAAFLRQRAEHEFSDGTQEDIAIQARNMVKESDGKPLVERHAKQLLQLYGIPVTNEALATTASEAVSIARDIGYPVVLKIESPDITHKTDAGGVLLNISDDAGVRDGFNQIIDRARRYDLEAELNGVLVQQMVTGGRELILGMTQDPDFGPAVAVGLGGIFVEVLKDIALGVPPLTPYHGQEMLARLRGKAILEGTRGEAPADTESVIDTISRFSQLCIDLKDDVAEIDINPLLVFDKGQGAMVVDCLIIPQ